MKVRYRVAVGVPPATQNAVIEISETVLGFKPDLIAGAIDLPQIGPARQLSTRLSERGILSSVETIVEYDSADLDRAALLRLIPLQAGDNIRRGPPAEGFETSSSARQAGAATSGPLYFDYASAQAADLLSEPFTRELVISSRLRKIFEERGLTGLRYAPLVDANIDERPVAKTIGYFLLETTCYLPLLDPRTLVTAWVHPDGAPQLSIVSELYYERGALTEWCDFNMTNGVGLGKRASSDSVVSQRVRDALLDLGVTEAQFEPVFIVGEDEPITIRAKSQSWRPNVQGPEIMPLHLAQAKYKLV
jgi:hypothetical protein